MKMELFICMLFAIVSVLGLEYFSSRIWRWLSKPKGKDKNITMIPVGEHDDNVEQMLRYGIARTEPQSEVIILDYFMSGENLQICELFAQKYEQIRIMTINQFVSYIEHRETSMIK